MRERVNEQWIWDNARWSRPGEVTQPGIPYLMDENKRRGIKTVSIIQPDGVIAFYTIQKIPDSFLEECKRSREKVAAMSSTRRNAALMLPSVEIPDSIATTLFSKDRDGGMPLAPNDPERDKRIQEFSNDRDFYKFRTSEGTL